MGIFCAPEIPKPPPPHRPLCLWLLDGQVVDGEVGKMPERAVLALFTRRCSYCSHEHRCLSPAYGPVLCYLCKRAFALAALIVGIEFEVLHGR